jgi:RNA polymerase sigma-70 factor (ECF subfamily)
MNQTDNLIPTRRSLLSRLKDWGDQEHWQQFFDTYSRLIYNTAIKGGLTDAEAQDALQETVLSVVKSMPTFQYDPQKGSFKSWLLNLTRWRILDQLERRDTLLAGRPGRAESSTRTATIERQPDPAGAELDAIWDREWEENLLERATTKVKQKVDLKQYQVFDLLVFKNWSVVRVARFFGLNPASVYMAKHRVVKLVAKEIAKLRDKPI